MLPMTLLLDRRQVRARRRLQCADVTLSWCHCSSSVPGMLASKELTKTDQGTAMSGFTT